jgi:hypothetical protein
MLLGAPTFSIEKVSINDWQGRRKVYLDDIKSMTPAESKTTTVAPNPVSSVASCLPDHHNCQAIAIYWRGEQLEGSSCAYCG